MKPLRMAVIRQRFRNPRLECVEARVAEELCRIGAHARLPSGGKIAITAGSRRIGCLPEVFKALAAFVRSRGCEPILVTAMGSHGGATAEGQKALLAGYGITEGRLGMPVRSSMDVELLGATEDGTKVYADSAALSARAIIVVNRVKPHTRFFGSVESGLTKMTLVGLGNRLGAEEYHRAAAQLGFDRVAEAAFALWRDRGCISLGLAIVENAAGQPAHIEAAAPMDFLDIDRKLLVRAGELMLTLPFQELDLLVVDRMGKDISGTGMDVNVIGAREGSGIDIAHVFVRELTDASEGNAHGIGFAAVTTTRLARKINMEATLANARTALRERAAVVPPAFETDRECLEYVLTRLERRSPQVVQIADTGHLERFRAGESLLPLIGERPELSVVAGPREVCFDRKGNLAPW